MALKLHEWENINSSDPDFEQGSHPVHRLRVPGGWLYKIRGNGFMTFVPKPIKPLILCPPA